MTKVYTVTKYSDAIHYKEVKTFSNFSKAMNFIEEDGEIIEIKVEKGCYWECEWFYKEYDTSVEWAKKILNRKNLENKRYITKNRKFYGIKITEVF